MAKAVTTETKAGKKTAKTAPAKTKSAQPTKPAKNLVCEYAIRTRQAANADEFLTITTLDLSASRLPSLDGLAGHPTLEVLYPPKLTSFAGLADMPRLREIYAPISKFDDISALANNLPVLEELNLQDSKVVDLSPLAACKALKKLNIGPKVVDLSPLAGLTELEDLVIRGKLGDLSPLGGLQNLTDLNIAQCSITDVSGLAPLVNLQNLWLFGNHKLSNIAALASLKKLEFVSLPPSVKDLSPLAFLPRDKIVQN